MRILVYEFVTGGGFLGQPAAPIPSGSLLTEGFQMAHALVEDLIDDPATSEVHVLQDARLPRRFQLERGCPGLVVHPVLEAGQHDQLLEQFAACSDWTVVIAPEMDGNLARVCRVVDSVGGRLLGPGTQTVQWASNKQQTAQRLQELGVPVPRGGEWDAQQLGDRHLAANQGTAVGLPGPVVVKPVDGAGSWNVRQLASFGQIQKEYPVEPGRTYRVEQWVDGQPASVALLLGPAGPVVLQPCWQHLSDDGCFTYRGGRVMSDRMEADAVARARRLAAAVAPLLAADVGYVGIDCVLARCGTEGDAVIELNPRLTSSYLGLRHAADMNLAPAMLAVANGHGVAPRWQQQPLDFWIE